jgi:hypothetical protein
VGGVARARERLLELGEQHPRDVHGPRASTQRQPIHIVATDEDRVRPESKGLEGVAAGTDAGIEQDTELRPNRLGKALRTGRRSESDADCPRGLREVAIQSASDQPINRA